MKPMFGVFSLATKFDCLFLDIFLKFLLICGFNFWQISPLPPWIYALKDALIHFLVNSSAKNSLRRANDVVFFLFCVLVSRPMGGAIAPPGYATEIYVEIA